MAEAEASVHEVRIDADPATVFDFFCDPDKATRWMGLSAELDPRPGGIYRVQIAGQRVARGEYVEVDRPDRVVFTWGWEGEESSVAPGASLVEVTFTPDGEATLVRLAHSRLPEGAGEPHGRGWDHFLPRLAVAARGGDPGPDPWAADDSES